MCNLRVQELKYLLFPKPSVLQSLYFFAYFSTLAWGGVGWGGKRILGYVPKEDTSASHPQHSSLSAFFSGSLFLVSRKLGKTLPKFPLFQSIHLHYGDYPTCSVCLTPAFPLEGKLLETGSSFIFSIWCCCNMNISTYWALMFWKSFYKLIISVFLTTLRAHMGSSILSWGHLGVERLSSFLTLISINLLFQLADL